MRVTMRPPSDLDLRWLEAEVERAAEVTLKGCAMAVANDAKASVARGPKTGRVYTTRFARNRTTGAIFPTEDRVPHQASAAGQPPATDTGKLVGSIVGDAKGLRGYVEARSVYAKWLEFGTRYMSARPFLLPAIERNRARCAALLRQAVQTAATRFAEKLRGG